MYGLPFVDIDVTFAGRMLHLKNILLDTGSAGTILDADVVTEIGVKPEGTDQTAVIHGIGGTEIVFTIREAKLVIDTVRMQVYTVS